MEPFSVQILERITRLEQRLEDYQKHNNERVDHLHDCLHGFKEHVMGSEDGEVKGQIPELREMVLNWGRRGKNAVWFLAGLMVASGGGVVSLKGVWALIQKISEVVH